MHNVWERATGQAVSRNRNIVPNPVGNYSNHYEDEETRESWTMTAAQAYVLGEFSVRWKCPVKTDPELYAEELKTLAWDCRNLAPGLFRKAGDRVAVQPGRFNVLPSASEIMQAVEQIMAERAATQARSEYQHPDVSPVTQSGVIVSATGALDFVPSPDLIDAVHERNRKLIHADSPWRLVAQGSCTAMVRVVDNGDITPVWRCNGDGTITQLDMRGQPLNNIRI